MLCTTSLCAQSPAPIDDINGIIVCSPQTPYPCQNVAFGRFWSMYMTGQAFCNTGQVIWANTSIQANCVFEAFGDVDVWRSQHLAYVYTEQGWIQRWFGGIEADATGFSNWSMGGGTWISYDRIYCDLYRDTYIQPMIPC